MTTSTGSLETRQLLTKVDKFCDSSQLEKLRLLATAILPYGKIQKSNVIEIYTELQERHRDSATSMIARLLDRASFGQYFIEQLQKIPACETPDIPLLYFTELLVDISDSLGNGEYFGKLKNRIPDHQLGSSRDGITTAVQLFQQLLHEQTISLDEDLKSLGLLAEWLVDIGRKDIAVKVEKEMETSR